MMKTMGLVAAAALFASSSPAAAQSAAGPGWIDGAPGDGFETFIADSTMRTENGVLSVVILSRFHVQQKDGSVDVTEFFQIRCQERSFRLSSMTSRRPTGEVVENRTFSEAESRFLRAVPGSRDARNVDTACEKAGSSARPVPPATPALPDWRIFFAEDDMTIAWGAGTVESNGETTTVSMLSKTLSDTDNGLVKEVWRVELNCARSEFRIIEVRSDFGLVPGAKTEVEQIPADTVISLLRDAVCAEDR